MRYPRYKPTGIPWLPEVPEEWGFVRAKYAFQKEQRPVRDGDEIVTCFRDGEVTLRKNRRLTGFTEATDYSHYQHICKGDLVIHQMDAFAGSCGVSDSDGMGTPVLSVCTPLSQEYLAQYFAKVVRLMGLNGYIHSLYRGIRERSSDFRFETFAKQWLPLPPLPTQHSIVAFLDEKCGKVDRLVAAKEKAVALLKELKQSMIAEAVCGREVKVKGEGEQRRFKPSGIPWLPEVPEGWEVRKMKYLFTERSDKGHPEEHPLCSTQAYGVIPQSLYENRVVVVNKDGLGQLKLVKEGDFVISLRSFQGGIEIAHYQGIISAAYTILEPRDNRNSAYFRYLFKSHAFIQLLQSCVTGIREGQNINYPLLSRKFIPIPPLAEQHEIVAHIEARAAKIDAAVSGLEREIAALKEYKQRLIADVVTGQRRVA